jgi:trans-2,3-dihydro-3-hydroxyanthranilate isomerase
MAKKINIYQIDAFTKNAFEGNPAGVTLGDGLTAEEMQKIAKEMNLAETAFLSKSDSNNADYNLRWFTPAVEVDLCGHATIASLHFLKENNLIKEGEEIKFSTRSGILNCRTENGKYFMQIPVFKTNEYAGDRNELIKALSINPNDLDEKVQFILVENGYLYIYIKTIKALENLSPNFKGLLQLSTNKKSFSAVTVFTLETKEKESFAHLRFYAPFYGIDEDPVTGSANGPLMLVLNKLGFIKTKEDKLQLQFEQGDFIGRRGRIGVEFSKEKNELYISGNAVTVLKGELSF